MIRLPKGYFLILEDVLEWKTFGFEVSTCELLFVQTPRRNFFNFPSELSYAWKVRDFNHVFRNYNNTDNYQNCNLLRLMTKSKTLDGILLSQCLMKPREGVLLVSAPWTDEVSFRQCFKRLSFCSGLSKHQSITNVLRKFKLNCTINNSSIKVVEFTPVWLRHVPLFNLTLIFVMGVRNSHNSFCFRGCWP